MQNIIFTAAGSKRQLIFWAALAIGEIIAKRRDLTSKIVDLYTL
jgi:hypothetical protein